MNSILSYRVWAQNSFGNQRRFSLSDLTDVGLSGLQYRANFQWTHAAQVDTATKVGRGSNRTDHGYDRQQFSIDLIVPRSKA